MSIFLTVMSIVSALIVLVTEIIKRRKSSVERVPLANQAELDAKLQHPEELRQLLRQERGSASTSIF